MTSREFVHRRASRAKTRASEEVEAAPPTTAEAEDILDGLDELLDEIDSVLEEQSVLVNYRQRGGQ